MREEAILPVALSLSDGDHGEITSGSADIATFVVNKDGIRRPKLSYVKVTIISLRLAYGARIEGFANAISAG
jgi:hypothetical protein